VALLYGQSPEVSPFENPKRTWGFVVLVLVNGVPVVLRGGFRIIGKPSTKKQKTGLLHVSLVPEREVMTLHECSISSYPRKTCKVLQSSKIAVGNIWTIVRTTPYNKANSADAKIRAAD
jgi:hypothetical protein